MPTTNPGITPFLQPALNNRHAARPYDREVFLSSKRTNHLTGRANPVSKGLARSQSARLSSSFTVPLVGLPVPKNSDLMSGKRVIDKSGDLPA